MTVTYKINSIGITVPVLHKVVYSRVPDPALYFVPMEVSTNHEMDEWLEKNCQHAYYHSPGYLPEKFIQFECDAEAVWFALRWGA